MKDLHKIFALYIGQNMLIHDIIEGRYGIGILKVVKEHQVIIYDDKNAEVCGYYNCKLILKPLEDITDEELKIIGYGDNKNTFTGHYKGLNVQFWKDELRELSFDCGYKDIPKLLETPIATTMEEAKKLIKKI